LIDNHGWADLRVSNALTLTPNSVSQKTKPQLANHDYQVIIQTESDDDAKDSSLKLALKHPAQTTIVQMDKDGAPMPLSFCSISAP
jgi:hypothetical protein